MKNLGLMQGRSGSSKIFTDDLRRVCESRNPKIDLESYEKGFYQGWLEYCLPIKGFEMGKRADRYISFCPAEREDLFRAKYLLGKRYNELTDSEEDISYEMEKIKDATNSESEDATEYKRLQTELEEIKLEMQQVEQEGKKDSFMFTNPL